MVSTSSARSVVRKACMGRSLNLGLDLGKKLGGLQILDSVERPSSPDLPVDTGSVFYEITGLPENADDGGNCYHQRPEVCRVRHHSTLPIKQNSDGDSCHGKFAQSGLW